jgi:protease-4
LQEGIGTFLQCNALGLGDTLFHGSVWAMIAAMRESTSSTRSGLGPLAWVLILSGTFFVLFVIITGGVYMARSPGDGGSGKSAGFLSGSGSVGIIELNGVIMDSKKILKKLDNFDEDDAIKAVVLRLNSPGGSVAPSQEIYEAVKAYKKPLVVSMSSVAASGAYYIACGAKKVFANPGTITGSIGVIMEFLNLQKLYEWAKVQRYSVKTGRYKDVGAEYREMTADERALLQNMVDDVLGQFRKAVSTGRKIPLERVVEIADGRIFSGQQAKEAKLVDELGTLQDAVNEAAKEAKIEGKPHVVYSEKAGRNRLLDLLLDDGGSKDEESRLGGGGLASFNSGDAGLIGRLAQALIGSPSAALSEIPGPGIYWLWKGAR